MNARPKQIILEDILNLDMYLYKIDGNYVDSSDNSLAVDRDELPENIKSEADFFMRYAFVDEEDSFAFFDFNTKVFETEHRNIYRGEFYMLDAFERRRFFDIVYRQDVNPEKLKSIMLNNNTKLYKFVLTHSDGTTSYSSPSVFKDSKTGRFSKTNIKKLHERIMKAVGNDNNKSVQLESIIQINESLYQSFIEMFENHSYINNKLQ